MAPRWRAAEPALKLLDSFHPQPTLQKPGQVRTGCCLTSPSVLALEPDADWQWGVNPVGAGGWLQVQSDHFQEWLRDPRQHRTRNDCGELLPLLSSGICSAFVG